MPQFASSATTNSPARPPNLHSAFPENSTHFSHAKIGAERLEGSTLQEEKKQALLGAVQSAFGEHSIVELRDSGLRHLALPLPKGSPGQDTPSEVIVVECGLKSVALCALAIRDQATLDQVLKLNPVLYNTLITRWGEHMVIWLRPYDWIPAEFSAEHVIWCSAGPMPVAVPGKALGEFVVASNPIQFLCFDTLQWPTELRSIVRERYLQATYGPLVRQAGPRKRVINDATACRMFGEALGLQYDTDARCFSMPNATTGAIEVVPESLLNDMLAQWLQSMAAEYPGSVPVQELRLARLQTMVQSMKVVCAVTRKSEREALLAYVQTRLERREGASLTPGEIYAHYFAECRRKGDRAFPECAFRDILPGLVREHLGLTKVHNILRPNGAGKLTARNGFNGLAIKKASDSDAAGAKDVADGVVHQFPEPPKTGAETPMKTEAA